jgi:hypothetical protein
LMVTGSVGQYEFLWTLEINIHLGLKGFDEYHF